MLCAVSRTLINHHRRTYALLDQQRDAPFFLVVASLYADSLSETPCAWLMAESRYAYDVIETVTIRTVKSRHKI